MEGGVSRFVWIIILVGMCGYFISSCIQDETKERANQAELRRVEQETKTAVAAMAGRTGAVFEWDKYLFGNEEYREKPLLTIELEKLWKTEKPILFIGSIKDIKTADSNTRTITINRSIFSSINYMFSEELMVELLVDKNKLDIFTEKHKDIFDNYGFNNGVAVIAKIENIDRTYILNENMERIDVIIGRGRLLEILYTGSAQF